MAWALAERKKYFKYRYYYRIVQGYKSTSMKHGCFMQTKQTWLLKSINLKAINSDGQKILLLQLYIKKKIVVLELEQTFYDR